MGAISSSFLVAHFAWGYLAISGFASLPTTGIVGHFLQKHSQVRLETPSSERAYGGLAGRP
jgi:hypothetical protein